MAADVAQPSAETIAAVRASFARQGFLQGLGAKIKALGLGECAVELPFSPNAVQQNGFFHGGIIGALADTAGGYAALTCMCPGSEVLTIEYKVNFLRPAAGQSLIAEAVVLRPGRTVSVTRADVYVFQEGQKALCAVLQQSIMGVTHNLEAT